MPNVNDQNRQTLARWTIALCEPLIESDVRAELDEQMSHLMFEQTEWLTTWFAGMLASTIASLPAEDPWRNLSALFKSDNNQTIAYESVNVPAPETTGARTRGRSFGTRRDHTDMIVPESNDWLIDLQLAAVSREIDLWSAALIGFACGGIETTTGAADLMFSQIVRERKTRLDPSTKDMTHIFASALKYAIHRRRDYVGLDDPFVWSKGFLWIVRAEQILGGRPFTQADLIADIEESKIPDGDYNSFRLQ